MNIKLGTQCEWQTYSMVASDNSMYFFVSADERDGRVTVNAIHNHAGLSCRIELTPDQAETLQQMLAGALASRVMEVSA